MPSFEVSMFKFRVSLKFHVSGCKFPLFSLVVPLTLLFGCSKPQQIGAGYSLSKSEDTFGNRPLTSLHFRGSNIWPAVLSGSEQSFHDGTFVFLAPVPGRAGDFETAMSPQLFAIRESGPAVLISERIYGQPMKRELPWSVENFVPSAAGLSVDIGLTQAGGSKARINRLVTWSEIERWLQEADTASVTNATPLAPYRILLFNAANAPRAQTNSLPLKGLDPLSR